MTDKGERNLNLYEIISKKRDGGELTGEEIEFFIDGSVKGEIEDYQAAALLMAIYIRGLDRRETADLTRVMMESGDLISLADIEGVKIDKHSTGGVGDKVSFVVAPLVAACGVKVPMLSGRSLGHSGGTLDKLESIPGLNVFLQPGDFKKMVKEVGMAICGQTENIVPADRKLYALRDMTATVTSIPLITASIMSKKLALGTDGIVLDVKTGSGAFMKNLEDSIELCKAMVAVGEASGRKTIGLITDMSQPLGSAVGNSLEIMESIEALKGRGPADLMEVTLGVGAAMLMAAGMEEQFDKAVKTLEEVLKSGKPLEIFKGFIAGQGGDAGVCDNYSLLPQSSHCESFPAERGGFITAIDGYETGMTAVDIGAGRRKKLDRIDHSAGFVFHKKIGDQVKKGEPILTIHSNKPESVGPARDRLSRAIVIDDKKVEKPSMIIHMIDKNGIRD
jgi:pyrimidine-nucleoside phosphorylase